MPPSYKHIIHFSLLTPPHSSKEATKNEHILEHFYTNTSVHLGVRVVLYTHVKKITYTSSISGPKIISSLYNLHVI